MSKRQLILFLVLLTVRASPVAQELGEDCYSSYRGAQPKTGCEVSQGLVRVSFHSYSVCLPTGWASKCETGIDSEDYWFGSPLGFSIRIHRLHLDQRDFSVVSQDEYAPGKKRFYVKDTEDGRVMAELVFEQSMPVPIIGAVVSSFQFRGHLERMKLSASCPKGRVTPAFLVVEEDKARRHVQVDEKFTRDFGVLKSLTCEIATITEAVQRADGTWIRYEIKKTVRSLKR